MDKILAFTWTNYWRRKRKNVVKLLAPKHIYIYIYITKCDPSASPTNRSSYMTALWAGAVRKDSPRMYVEWIIVNEPLAESGMMLAMKLLLGISWSLLCSSEILLSCVVECTSWKDCQVYSWWCPIAKQLKWHLKAQNPSLCHWALVYDWVAGASSKESGRRNGKKGADQSFLVAGGHSKATLLSRM